MRIITLDFETYWDREYSLSKMSPLEYVQDPRFEVISVAVKYDDHPTDVIWQPDIERTFSKMSWAEHAVCGHNTTGFDAYILAYRYGIRPKLWLDTLAMARPRHAKTTGLGLGKLVEHYADELRAMGLNPVKDGTVLVQTQGKRYADFTPAERDAMEVYNRQDTDLCRGLFKILKRHFSSAELWQIDTLVRMRTEPQFELDMGLLETAASVERDRKRKALLDLSAQLGFTSEEDEDVYEGAEEYVREQLASSAKFATLLERLGVEVPMKPSPTNPENQIPALSKTDEEFLKLQDHKDPLVAAAARARLDVKSTLLETRIEKFLTAGRLAGGRLPIPLKYCGADTTGRDSGEDYNPQNQPRINPNKPQPSDALRRSLRAPAGYVVGVADQSGIELRVDHFLWQVPSSMALYRASPDKADLYRAFAAESLFRVPPDSISKQQRQVAKVAQLGLGFGSGAATFQRIARIMGGIDLPLDAEDTSTLTASSVVATWRAAYPEIVNGWRRAGDALQWIANGEQGHVDPWKLVHTTREGFVLPSGRLIYYPNLRQEDDGYWSDGRPKKSWFYADGRHKARLTGPKSVENLVQALARDSIFDCAVEFYRTTGFRPALRVHDELVYVWPEREAEALLAHLQKILRTPPRWWPELVVWSEGDVAPCYGDAK